MRTSIYRTTRLTLAVAALCFGAAATHAQPVTAVITHGYSLDGSKGAWIENMGEAMLARAGGGVGGGVIFRHDQFTGVWRRVSGSFDPAQPVVLIYRWLEDFDKTGPDWRFVEGAGDALYAILRDGVFVDESDNPLPAIDLITNRSLHCLGHSRGACVNSETIRRFARAGITVDHMTTMDPHPVDGTLDPPFSDFEWGDPTPRRWSNVAFADNYWRADGGGLIDGFDFDGIPVDSAHNVELDEGALNCCAYGFAHSDTHLWYHGTIDLSPNPCDGEQCITNQMRSTWYTVDGGDFTQTGFYYSVIGGGVADRPTLPAGIDPGEVPMLYNGDFDQASYTGWFYHGGAASSIVNEGGRTFLKFGAGTATSATHNLFYLEPGAGSIDFAYNTLTPNPATLQLTLFDKDGGGFIIPTTLDLSNATTGWNGTFTAPIPSEIPRGATYTLRFETISGGTITATVGVDDITIEQAPPNPADLTGDGAVDTFDLLLMLENWGPCADPCPPNCAGDITGPAEVPDCIVDTFDLLMLLAAWG